MLLFGVNNKLKIIKYIFESNQAPYTEIESGIIQRVQLNSVNKIDSGLERLVTNVCEKTIQTYTRTKYKIQLIWEYSHI